MRDRVTPELHAAVLTRDRQCVLAKMDPAHVCRDIFGNVHRSDDLGRLTLEHVKTELRMGRRAPSDLEHLIALCGFANNAVPSKAQRQAFRAYLLQVNAPAEHEHVDPVPGCVDCYEAFG